jgi:O-antigen/teichoic acid export membrane protein
VTTSAEDSDPTEAPDVTIARSGAGAEPTLFDRVSRSIAWNALLLPLITVLNALTSILVRRGFGLHSAAYDILLGLSNTLLFYTSLGIPTSLSKFLPEREHEGGRAAALGFLQQAGSLRVGLLVATLVPVNVFAEPLAARLLLGEHGALYIHVVSALAIGRATFELVIEGLHSNLGQLSVNLLTLSQAVGEPTLIGLALFLGYGIGGVVGALAISALGLTVAGLVPLARALAAIPARIAADARAPVWRDRAFWRFAIFTYVYELSLYFGGPDFSRTVLGAALGDASEVALFSVGYYVALMVVVMMVSGFRGVYRPMFARLRVSGDSEQLRRAFSVVTKVQIALLLPAAVGLEVMMPSYIPLLYGRTFEPAVPVARVLVAFLFTETAFNLGNIILSIDERYRPVLAAQSILVFAAPAFLWTARHHGLIAGVTVLGTARLAAVLVGYFVARARYGARFPWPFALRAAPVAAAMGGALLVARPLAGTSALATLALTAAGVVVFIAAARVARLFGPDEIELVRRSRIPGRSWLLAWLG